jgi:hypothetical protein
MSQFTQLERMHAAKAGRTLRKRKIVSKRKPTGKVKGGWKAVLKERVDAESPTSIRTVRGGLPDSNRSRH